MGCRGKLLKDLLRWPFLCFSCVPDSVVRSLVRGKQDVWMVDHDGLGNFYIESNFWNARRNRVRRIILLVTFHDFPCEPCFVIHYWFGMGPLNLSTNPTSSLFNGMDNHFKNNDINFWDEYYSLQYYIRVMTKCNWWKYDVNPIFTHRTTCLCLSTQYLIALRTISSCFLVSPFGFPFIPLLSLNVCKVEGALNWAPQSAFEL